MRSSQDLLALKPLCSSTRMLLLSRNVDILRFIIPVKSFPIVDIKLILLKLTGSLGSKCEPFGKGLIRDLSHSVGARQVLKKFSKRRVKIFHTCTNCPGCPGPGLVGNFPRAHQN